MVLVEDYAKKDVPVEENTSRELLEVNKVLEVEKEEHK